MATKQTGNLECACLVLDIVMHQQIHAIRVSLVRYFVDISLIHYIIMLGVHVLGYIDVDCSTIPECLMEHRTRNGVLRYRCSFELEMKLSSAEAIFYVKKDGISYGSCRVVHE